MYLVVVGWLYVVIMMVVAEATNPNGSILGAIVTFFFYGFLPVTLVIYLMASPHRRRLRKAREAAELAINPETVQTTGPSSVASNAPDTGGHSTAAAQAECIAAVRKKP